MKQNLTAERDILRPDGDTSCPRTASPEDVYPLSLHRLQIYRVQAFEAFPGLRHAIFTRHHGFSQSPFHSLNFSVSVGDEDQTVQQNFRHACQSLAVRPEQTVSTRLVHGAAVLSVESLSSEHFIGEADSLITATPDLYLFMRFGDCAPLLFFDPIRRAVGLAHAGWRGTMQNVAGATVKQMVTQYGCHPADIIAVIGPAIGPCCYEVGQDVIDAVHQTFGSAEGLLSFRGGKGHLAHLDLEAANAQQLTAAGLQQIIRSGLCTACRRDEFFSHRAEKGRTGRFGVLIGVDRT
ncbi:MAG TPA: peptidoglycan editing factor PgeF [Anaerolineae bacterium]|nr:peptidoglycan editing factor PgeF [Anaerolineae bacterium]